MEKLPGNCCYTADTHAPRGWETETLASKDQLITRLKNILAREAENKTKLFRQNLELKERIDHLGQFFQLPKDADVEAIDERI